MKTIMLQDEQIKNLNIFLDRVPLTGRIEAIGMVELVEAIKAATETEVKVKK